MRLMATDGYIYGQMQRIKFEGEITHFAVKYSDRNDNNFTYKTIDWLPCVEWSKEN